MSYGGTCNKCWSEQFDVPKVLTPAEASPLRELYAINNNRWKCPQAPVYIARARPASGENEELMEGDALASPVRTTAHDLTNIIVLPRGTLDMFSNSNYPNSQFHSTRFREIYAGGPDGV